MKNNNLKNKLTLVILGRSGSGKGTQARFILQKLGRQNSHHMETGRFLRALLEKANPTTLLARNLLHTGKIFPSWMAAYTWLRELIEKGTANKHLVFDGAPRKVWEAELLDEVLKWHNRPLPICIYVDVSSDEVIKRLLGRGRADDTISSIRSRLRFFEKEVRPVLNYYRKRGRLLYVDGNLPVEQVKWAVDRVLVKRLRKRWPR